MSAPGCAPVAQFSPNGSTATLSYVVPRGAADYNNLWYVDRKQCPETAHLARLYASSPLRPDGGAGTLVLTIPADTPFMFYMTAARRGYTCENAGVFRPEPGRDYELKYVIAPVPFLCIAQVLDLKRGSSGLVSEVAEPTAHLFYPPSRQANYCRVSLKRIP